MNHIQKFKLISEEDSNYGPIQIISDSSQLECIDETCQGLYETADDAFEVDPEIISKWNERKVSQMKAKKQKTEIKQSNEKIAALVCYAFMKSNTNYQVLI